MTAPAAAIITVACSPVGHPHHVSINHHHHRSPTPLTSQAIIGREPAAFDVYGVQINWSANWPSQPDHPFLLGLFPHPQIHLAQNSCVTTALLQMSSPNRILLNLGSWPRAAIYHPFAARQPPPSASVDPAATVRAHNGAASQQSATLIDPLTPGPDSTSPLQCIPLIHFAAAHFTHCSLSRPI